MIDKNGKSKEKDARESEELDDNSGKGGKDKSLKNEILDWIKPMITVIIVTLLVKTFLFDVVEVSGPSMQPTLHSGDRVIVVKFAYKPKIDDIFIFKPLLEPNRPFVKRVVGVAGDTIDILPNSGTIVRNGVAVEQSYETTPSGARGNILYPAEVRPGTVFAMGDNRGDSRDSRFGDIGLVQEKSIVGHAVFRIWPFNTFGTLK